MFSTLLPLDKMAAILMMNKLMQVHIRFAYQVTHICAFSLYVCVGVCMCA